jgi:DNA-binding response OmpR family regulator
VRLLLVEDEERLAASIARGLESEGFAVDVTHDGTDGLWRAREGTYAAIILDVMLPGLNGYQICRTLREEQNWTPILMLTAKDGEYDEAEGLDTGADDWLTKPFSFVVLVARLRALVRRGDGGRPVGLAIGDLHVDLPGHTCRRGSDEIGLTPREFDLLVALLRRRDRVASKRDLLDEVWGLDFAGDPNVVEVYVGYLRRKIDRPYRRQSLQTVRGTGYRLVDDQAGLVS